MTLEKDGSVVCRVGPAFWFRLHPGIVTEAHEEPDHRLLRVEMGASDAFVIETRG